MTRRIERTLLSAEEVAELKDGTEIFVTWSGGNGPHLYRVGHVDGAPVALTDLNGRTFNAGDLSRLIGREDWQTQVSLAEEQT